MKQETKGLIHIYTGDGKGKTTAAVGLGIRAFGSGMRVLLIQFLKGGPTGELQVLQGLGEGFQIMRHEKAGKFTWKMNEEEMEELKKQVRNLFQDAVLIASQEKDMVIFDEMMAVLSLGFIAPEEIIDFLARKPAALEVVLTGRNAPDELKRIADYVSDITVVKHPMDSGIQARKGIEY